VRLAKISSEERVVACMKWRFAVAELEFERSVREEREGEVSGRGEMTAAGKEEDEEDSGRLEGRILEFVKRHDGILYKW